jgi:exodeoxyribonuclease VIII
MKERLFSHFYAKSLLINGRAEVGYVGVINTIFGEIQAKFKPDYTKDIRHLVIDLKTCQDASVDGFTRSAAEYDMHIQAAFYADLLSKIEGEGREYTFIFIAQEKKAPFAFNIFEASQQFISQGRYEYEHLLQLYKFCQDNNRWPGYQVFCQNKYGINELKLPQWAIKSLDFYDHNYSLNNLKNGKQLASSN